jgi:prepilin-type N-terminal cleavage/methylation domain-containing protein
MTGRARYAKSAGFTLVEIIIAVVIIGIMTAMAIPSYRRLNENMKFEDALGSTKAAFNKCRGEAVSMESATDMGSAVTMPVSMVLFPNGYACIVWLDRSSDFILGGGGSVTPSDDGELAAGDANGEVRSVLFQERYNDHFAINEMNDSTHLDSTDPQSILSASGVAQNDGSGYLFRILPGGYFLASNGGMLTARFALRPNGGPQSLVTLYPSGQLLGD